MVLHPFFFFLLSNTRLQMERWHHLPKPSFGLTDAGSVPCSSGASRSATVTCLCIPGPTVTLQPPCDWHPISRQVLAAHMQCLTPFLRCGRTCTASPTKISQAAQMVLPCHLFHIHSACQGKTHQVLVTVR